MTVQELIEKLQEFPSDCEIIKQVDDEGNGYQAMYAVDLAYDDEDHSYPSVSDDLEDHYEDGETPSGKKVVVIV